MTDRRSPICILPFVTAPAIRAIGIVSAMTFLSAGCRPQPPRPAPARPAPEIELTGSPLPEPGPDTRNTPERARITGIFNGQWTTGSRVYYDIIHHLNQPPVISVIPQRHGVIEVGDVHLDGYTLQFNQFVHPSPGEEPEPGAPPGSTTVQWRVALRIALNNVDNMLLEMDRIGSTNHITRLLRRVYKTEEPEENAPLAREDAPAATNAAPVVQP